MQRQVGKFILKACRHTANEAILGDLGWNTMSSRLNIMKLKYYKRLCDMNNSRWTKRIFNQLITINDEVEQNQKKLCWNWTKYTSDIMANLNISDIQTLTDKNIKQIVCDKDENVWRENITKKSTLAHYQKFKTKLQCEEYLMSSINDFSGAQLKFKARSYTLGLQYEKRKWENDDSDCICPCCGLEDETLEHFLFKCNFYSSERQKLMKETEELLLNSKELNLYKDFKDRKELFCFFLGDSIKNYKMKLFKEIDNLFKTILMLRS